MEEDDTLLSGVLVIIMFAGIGVELAVIIFALITRVVN